MVDMQILDVRWIASITDTSCQYKATMGALISSTNGFLSLSFLPKKCLHGNKLDLDLTFFRCTALYAQQMDTVGRHCARDFITCNFRV